MGQVCAKHEQFYEIQCPYCEPEPESGWVTLTSPAPGYNGRVALSEPSLDECLPSVDTGNGGFTYAGIDGSMWGAFIAQQNATAAGQQMHNPVACAQSGFPCIWPECAALRAKAKPVVVCVPSIHPTPIVGPHCRCETVWHGGATAYCPSYNNP